MRVGYAAKRDKPERAYFAAFALRCLAVAMPHAFLTMVFLARGVDYAGIAVIQAFYSLGVIIFEYPSGLLADRFQKKAVYLFSSLLLALSYAVVIFTRGFAWLVLAWFIYGISMAMETGTIDAELVVWARSCGDEAGEGRLSGFIGACNQISSVAAICGSGLGFILFSHLRSNVYWLMMALVIAGATIILLFYTAPPAPAQDRSRGLFAIAKESVEELRASPRMRHIVALFGILQVLTQVHYQLWQSLFLDFGLDSSWFLGIYFTFQLLTFLAYRMPVAKVFSRGTALLAALATVSAVAMCVTDIPVVKVVAYMIPVFVITSMQYLAEVRFNEVVDAGTISSTTSLLSTVMRLFGFVALIAASVFLSAFPIGLLFPCVSIGTVISACMVIDRRIMPESDECTQLFDGA